MKYITVGELRKNLNYYIELSKTEDIFITNKGEVISVMVNPQIKALNDVCGIIANTKVKEQELSDCEIICDALDKKYC